MVQEIQIGRNKPRRWKRKRSTIKFRRSGTFGSCGRGPKLDNQNVGRRLEYESFDHRSSSQKARKSIEIDWMGPHELSDYNKAECARIFTDLLQRYKPSPFLKNLVTGIDSWLLFKNVKRKKVCVSPSVNPKEYRKASTVRRQCGVCHLSTCLLLIVPWPKNSMRSRNDCAIFQPFSKW